MDRMEKPIFNCLGQPSGESGDMNGKTGELFILYRFNTYSR